MDLPKKEESFYFDKTSEMGNRYEGTFMVLCSLNMAQKHALELEKTKLLGGFTNPTDSLAGLSIILANLRVKIIDGPSWWLQSNGGYTIEDEDIIVLLYKELQDAEVKWKEKLKEKAQALKDQSSPSSTP